MLKQTLTQKLQQKLSPQQIQLMKLLQIPTLSLEQRIKEELEENPALEEGAEEEEILDLSDDDIQTIDEEDDLSDDEDEYKDEIEEPTEVEHHEKAVEDFDYDTYFEDDEVPSYRLEVNNTSPDDDKKETPLSFLNSYKDSLVTQLSFRNLTETQMQVAQFIIGNLDDDGYLRRELTSIVDDLAFSQNINCSDEEALEILKEIQQLDPAGVGARNLQECLLLQLKAKKPSMNVVMAYKILNEYFEEFTKKHYEKIIAKLELTEEEMKGALSEILKLNPKPGGSSAEASKGATAVEITPDFILYNHDGELELQLNSANSYDLRVSKQYVEMLQEYGKDKTKTAREAVSFVKQKIDAAKWFIDALRQRQETLLMVMRSILAYQYEFFTSGDETKIKPMILKDIADRTNLDISTISRVVNSKYIQTEYGIILLKFFFSESLSTDSGEEVSTREVKKILDDCIGNENKRKPLTDDELALVLKEKGYNIARRTVAKYREQLNIPVARLRKEL